MDGGQRHTPSGRRVINGSSEQQPVYRQQEVSQQPQQQPVAPQQQAQASTGATLAAASQAAHRPAPVSRGHQTAKEAKPTRRFKLPIAILAGIIVLGALGFFGWSLAQNKGMVIDSGKYQAVFFTNGQVYFGKLKNQSSDYLHLSDVYYLQTDSDTASQNPQQATATDQSNVQLIKLGDEIHGPEDEMIISKDQVLFYENLKSDGKVSQSIQQYKNSNN